MKEYFFWLVDVVIIHFRLTIFGNEDDILNLWSDALRVDTGMNDKLRARISWHIIEIDFMDRCTRKPYSGEVPDMSWTRSSFYLQSVLQKAISVIKTRKLQSHFYQSLTICKY
jgi:hypothetical protein